MKKYTKICVEEELTTLGHLLDIINEKILHSLVLKQLKEMIIIMD